MTDIATPISNVEHPQTLPVWLRIALAAVIASGLAMRVIEPGTTVFCNDQARACALAEDIAAGRWESAGLVNSGGFRNMPGFAYLLAGVWKICPSPLALLYFTNAVNILAVLGALFLMRRWLGSPAAWWGAAFLASAPWAIQYSRWIWAQDLLFPAAMLVYAFLGRWLRGSRWAVLGLILSLALLVQIHLAGMALAIALAIYLLWARPKVAIAPAVIGCLVAIASALPYLLGHHLGAPGAERTGYVHFWRVFVGAAMSVTGLGWNLEFKEGYPAFVASLSWRHWGYLAVLSLPALLLAAGMARGLARLWRQRRAGPETRRQPLPMIAALVILVLIGFDLMGIRTSPTYLPVWYPLPFALMGWAAVALIRRRDGQPRVWLMVILLGVMAVQLSFFAEQLNYMRFHGGVPGSIIPRSYGGAAADVEAAAERASTSEVYFLYEGNSAIQDEAAAWLLRHASWAGDSPGRTLLRFGWASDASRPSVTAAPLPEELPPPQGAFQVRPWKGPQQEGGKIQRGPNQ
jgi:hypothetical protein